MGTTSKYIHLTTPYMRYKSRAWIEATHEAYHFEGDGVTTVPVEGAFVKPSRYTASWRRTIVPLWNTSSLNKYYSVPAVPFRTESCWSHFSGDNLILKAMSDVGERKMNLGETLAESKQTFHMIARNATAIAMMFRYLKRGDFRRAARAVGLRRQNARNYSRDISNKYLEFIFGWKPLIEEVYNGIDVVQNGLNRHERHAYITCKAGDERSLSRWTAAETTRPPGVTYTDARGHVSFTYQFTHPSYGRSLNQLGLYNPVSLAWNLLPYSFLIDWFIPVGNYLDAFSAKEGLTFKDAYSTSFCKHLFQGEAGYKAKWPRPCTLESGLIQRRLLTDRPPLPDVELDLSIQKAVTAVALVLQRR